MAQRPSALTLDIQRVISVGQDRKTGEAILRLKETGGRTVVLRLRPGQFRTLAIGVLGLAEARSSDL